MSLRKQLIVIFLLVLALFLLISDLTAEDPAPKDQKKKVIVGWLEKAYLPEYDFALRAKMDTGAKNSSLHAVDLGYVPVEGKPPQSRVRFKTEDANGDMRIIEADVVRIVSIKKSVQTSSIPIVEARVEIELNVCLSDIVKRIRVNLTDRAGMNYRMLLGRSALEGDFLVDVSRKFTAGSLCRDKHAHKPTHPQ